MQTSIQEICAPVSTPEIDKLIGALRNIRNTQQKVIAVFGYGSYGDALQTMPLLRQLKCQFGDAFICFIHVSSVVPALFGDNRLADEIFQLLSEHFEATIDAIKDENLADLIVRGRYVVGYTIPPLSKLNRDERSFVNAAQAVQREWLPLMRNYPLDNDQLWLKANAEGLNVYSLMATTAGFPQCDFENLQLDIDDADCGMGQELPERFYVVNNSAENLTKALRRNYWTKCLTQDKMARVVSTLKDLGLPSVLLGAPSAPNVDGVDFDLRGRTTLRQSAALIKRSAFWLAPEGGIANLGQAVGKRGIVFFASTPPQFFAYRNNINVLPRRCGGCWWSTYNYLYHCPRLQRTPECGESIDEQEVLAAARSLTQ